ncbi:heat-inducible transcriptional repressor HrcA [Chloroflexota bacterium]
MLSSRAETVLESIVGQYITSTLPVSSQKVTDVCGLMISPATIRNEMVNLEDEGYIIRPHHSAGSIPSDKGYRHYVNSIDKARLPLVEQRLVSHLFHQVEEKLEEWIGLAATLIAQLSQNVALVTMPKPTDCRFGYVELMGLQSSVVLAVFVLYGAKVKQQLITFDQIMPQPVLTTIANKLNQAYYGLTTAEILAKNVEPSSTESQLTDCLVRIMRAEEEQECDEPHIEGLQFTLNQPEFAHSYRVQGLVKLMEQRNLLRTITPRELLGHSVQVVIGRENKAEVLYDYSVVIGRYGLAKAAVGTIGVIGSTRMPYTRTIAVVNYLSSVLSELVARLYGKDQTAKQNWEVR